MSDGGVQDMKHVPIDLLNNVVKRSRERVDELRDKDDGRLAYYEGAMLAYAALRDSQPKYPVSLLAVFELKLDSYLGGEPWDSAF